MANSIDLRRINGNDLSWGSCVIRFAGARIWGPEEIDFGDKRVRELVWGMDRAGSPRARTRGEYQPDEGRCLVPLSTAVLFRQRIAAAAGSTSYGDAEFLIDLQWRENGDAPFCSVQLVDTVIISDKISAKRGPGVQYNEFGIQYKRIVRNGLTLYSAEAD